MTGVNTSLNLTGTDAVSEVLSLKPCSVVLETLPIDILEKSSRYLQSSVDHSRQDDDPYEAESDSGDSLFLTQKPVPKAVRSRRRYRSTYKSDLTSASGSDETEDEPSAPASQGKSKRCKQSRKKIQLSRLSFPFLSKIRDDKHQPRRRRRMRRNQDHLTSRKNKELHNYAMGGFFKCVRELQEGNAEAPTAFLDEDGDISPLSEGEDDGSDLEDIKVVKKMAFVVSCKRPQPWYTPPIGNIIIDLNQEKHVVWREESELWASCEAANDDREKRKNKKRRVREDEEDGERSPPSDAGGGSLNDQDVAIKRKEKKRKSFEVTEEPSNLSLDSLQKQSTGSCEALTALRKKCKKKKKSSCDNAAEAVEEKEDEDAKHCDDDVAVCGQAVKKKRKKEGEKSISQTSEDAATAAQSDDSVSVQETEKTRAASVCAAEAVEKETQTQTRQEKAESVYAPSGEKGVHACDFEADSAEREANGTVKDKKRKRKICSETDAGGKREKELVTKVDHGPGEEVVVLKKKKKSKQAPVSVMQEAESQTPSLNTNSSVSHKRKSKESSASLLNNTDETVNTSERASSSSTDPASSDIKVKKGAEDISPEETDPVRPEKSEKMKTGSHSPSHEDTLSSSDKVKKDKDGKGKRRLYNPSEAFMDI
ncbi:uncharacterized protein LOC143014768 [Genypterus blacodes]|uniref:uncharacterized protein LOC143014768 n=1 Tax=Genypterus blacodes TaxID=154954 RepID=UPI003F76CE60